MQASAVSALQTTGVRLMLHLSPNVRSGDAAPRHLDCRQTSASGRKRQPSRGAVAFIRRI